MKYKAGQVFTLDDGYQLQIHSTDNTNVDYTLWLPNGDWEAEENSMPESTIDSIISHHNWRMKLC